MFGKVNYMFWLVSLCVLIVGLTGCGEDDENELVGMWTLETVDGKSIQEQVEKIKLRLEDSGEVEVDISFTHILMFSDDGAWSQANKLEC